MLKINLRSNCIQLLNFKIPNQHRFQTEFIKIIVYNNYKQKKSEIFSILYSAENKNFSRVKNPSKSSIA